MSVIKKEDKLIIDTDSLYKHMKSVESCETKIYACSSGVPTIGVGFALLIEDSKDKKWGMRKKLFDKNGELDEAEITLPKDIVIF